MLLYVVVRFVLKNKQYMNMVTTFNKVAIKNALPELALQRLAQMGSDDSCWSKLKHYLNNKLMWFVAHSDEILTKLARRSPAGPSKPCAVRSDACLPLCAHAPRRSAS